MTRIRDLIDRGPTLSFEFFPPKNEEGRQRLRQTVRELGTLEPSFGSVTYGAGGSTRDATQEIVADLQADGQIMPMPHLTCIAHTRSELRTILAGYRDQGLDNILALHGDPPRDNPDIEPGDLRLAVELVELARDVGDFCVAVAAHPEGHPKAPDLDTDRKHQAAKLKEADFAVTQFFFRVEDYFRLVDDMERLGVDTPIIPGVIPVTNATQTKRFAEMAGAAFPEDLLERFEAVGDDAAAARRIGVELATEICQALIEQGAPGLHLYTLNRADACREVYTNLGITVS
jgi:methylenetetrahydrofolate reductase (NADPH)